MSMYTFEWVLEAGAICGLRTIGEAVLNFDLHASQFLPYDEIPAAVAAIYEEFAKRGDGPIPPEIVANADKELEEYFKQQGAR